LKSTAIHEFARIVSIVDVYDALASDRPYKKAFPTEQVISILEEGRGEFFDPTFLDLFLSNIDSFVAIRDNFQDSAHERLTIHGENKPGSLLVLPALGFSYTISISKMFCCFLETLPANTR
jgi:HD-GYP domain-containing protein (c-di-GMP phosphodiesterase class II)